MQYSRTNVRRIPRTCFLKTDDVMVSSKQMFPTGTVCFLCDKHPHQLLILFIPNPHKHQNESLLVRQLAGTCIPSNPTAQLYSSLTPNAPGRPAPPARLRTPSRPRIPLRSRRNILLPPRRPGQRQQDRFRAQLQKPRRD